MSAQFLAVFVDLLCRKSRFESSGNLTQPFPCGVVGNTVGSHPATPGSIPGKGDFIFFTRNHSFFEKK